MLLGGLGQVLAKHPTAQKVVLGLNSRFQKFLKMLIDDLCVRRSALCVRYSAVTIHAQAPKGPLTCAWLGPSMAC